MVTSAGKPFPEADSIIWTINPLSADDLLTTIEVYSSCHWLDSLDDVETFESSASPDKTASPSC